MPGKSKKGGGLESSPIYKKQAYGTAKSPFMMKSSPAKVGDYVATAANPKKQKFVDKAFAAKNNSISKLMSKHNISKSEATKLYTKNITK